MGSRPLGVWQLALTHDVSIPFQDVGLVGGFLAYGARPEPLLRATPSTNSLQVHVPAAKFPPLLPTVDQNTGIVSLRGVTQFASMQLPANMLPTPRRWRLSDRSKALPLAVSVYLEVTLKTA